MSLLDIFRNPRRNKNSAGLAKERLQIIISHERRTKKEDFLPLLQKDIIEVISRYIKIDKEQIKVALEHDNANSVLELNITLPQQEEVA